MATIVITGDEFGDFTISFLLDAMINDEILPDNEAFQRVVKNMERKGMKAVLLQEFLRFKSQQRIQYKRIKPSFEEGNKGSNIINITNTGFVKEDIEIKETLQKEQVRETIDKVLLLLKKRRRKTGLPVSRKNTEKIIEKVLSQETYLTEEKDNG